MSSFKFDFFDSIFGSSSSSSSNSAPSHNHYHPNPKTLTSTSTSFYTKKYIEAMHDDENFQYIAPKSTLKEEYAFTGGNGKILNAGVSWWGTLTQGQGKGRQAPVEGLNSGDSKHMSVSEFLYAMENRLYVCTHSNGDDIVQYKGKCAFLGTEETLKNLGGANIEPDVLNDKSSIKTLTLPCQRWCKSCSTYGQWTRHGVPYLPIPIKYLQNLFHADAFTNIRQGTSNSGAGYKKNISDEPYLLNRKNVAIKGSFNELIKHMPEEMTEPVPDRVYGPSDLPGIRLEDLFEWEGSGKGKSSWLPGKGEYEGSGNRVDERGNKIS